MSDYKVDAVARTVEKTQVWLKQIGRELDAADSRVPYHALRAVLHAIRDRLPVEQVAALGAQLPLLIRGIYYEGWHPHGKPLNIQDAQGFLGLVSIYLEQDAEVLVDEARVVAAVFQVMRAHLAPGEIDTLLNSMPTPIQQVFFGRA